MTIYQEEMQRKAQHYGCLTDYDEADQLLLISHKGVHLTAVNPEGFMYYARAEYLNNEDSFHDYYSDVEISYAASKAHPKAAIQIRNREMVDRADLVLCAIERQSGGAWQTVQYAMKQEKPVINLFDEPDE